MNGINAIRMLSVDMIEQANSGHPGICLGAAPMMYSLYSEHLNIYAKKSNWFNRDRFILAAGHGSAMLYSTLHLAGYDISLTDLKQFRKLNSKTPGHPEVGHTDGIDATSGPLGQGIAQAVGFAMAEAHLATKFNVGKIKVVDHYTYVLCGDGDLQEGISAEASSLAGHLKLNKLIVLWDSNDIQLDDKTSVATSEDILKRYESYGWNTLKVEKGHDSTEISKAIESAKKSDKPTMIEVKTVIGHGSPNKEGTPACHGAPLGRDEVVLLRKKLKYTANPFEIADDIYEEFAGNTIENGENKFKEWEANLEKLKEKDTALYNEFIHAINNGIDYNFKIRKADIANNEATRVSSGKAINIVAKLFPNVIGGSADLSKSNNSLINDSGVMSAKDYSQRNISYGVREFAMGAISNGIVLHGGLRAYCATFFVFSDYLKPAMRMSALQNIPMIYVLTHDSVAVGEDGPTHQPIEQLSGLRAIPNLNVIRPADSNETLAAWKVALTTLTGPTAIVLSRQNLPLLRDNDNIFENVRRGAYVVSDMEDFDKVLIGTGSEVHILLEAQKILAKNGMKVRVISMPSINSFLKQSITYQEAIFGESTRRNRYFVEMATAQEAYRFADNIFNIETFGLSGDGNKVINEFGFTAEQIAERIIL